MSDSAPVAAAAASASASQGQQDFLAFRLGLNRLFRFDGPFFKCDSLSDYSCSYVRLSTFCVANMAMFFLQVNDMALDFILILNKRGIFSCTSRSPDHVNIW